MNAAEGLAFWRTTPLGWLPIYFEKRALTGYCFDWVKAPDGRDVLVYCDESEITPAHVLIDGGRAVFDHLTGSWDVGLPESPQRAAWRRLCDRTCNVVPRQDTYGEMFGLACAELWEPNPGVPDLDVFKSAAAEDEVRAFILDLVPRTMWDSTNAGDIPVTAAMVGGYVDGRFRWSDADWARFPNAVKVRIAIFATTDDGDVADVENGAMTPLGCLAWTRLRRAGGHDPSAYVNLSNVQAVRDVFAAMDEPVPHLWLAHYDGIGTIPDGFVAKQYADEALTGGHYDLSVVADVWPGVDGGTDMTDDELRAALKRVYSGPNSLEELVKADVRVMVEQDPETRAAIVGVVKEKLGS